MILYQTGKLPSGKRNDQQNEKATYGMGENICKSPDKGLTSKIYKELIQFKSENETKINLQYN